MCLTPIVIKDQRTGERISVPCSSCPKCLQKRVSGWAFRLLQELKVSDSAHFLTLTYDSKHVPISPKGALSLDKKDLQLFFKRLRKAHPKDHRTIKYYACGEYGGRTYRPHYHIIMFNAKLELIQPAWDKGHIYYGSVTPSSVGYTLKYMCKPKGNWDKKAREFSLMSKGLGASYLTQPMLKWHKDKPTGRLYIPLEDGKKAPMPRYYKQKIYERELYSEIAGFLKGEYERKTMERMARMKPEKLETYARDLREATRAAFEKLSLKSLNRQRL